MKHIWQTEKVDNWVSPAQTFISINTHKFGNKKMVKAARSGFRDVLTKLFGQINFLNHHIQKINIYK